SRCKSGCRAENPEFPKRSQSQSSIFAIRPPSSVARSHGIKTLSPGPGVLVSYTIRILALGEWENLSEVSEN
uniref:Uncharacterized protein n=1 Tax=Anopheles albimanus TaxID=7167 RepID=A0A182F0N9_ANOAL